VRVAVFLFALGCTEPRAAPMCSVGPDVASDARTLRRALVEHDRAVMRCSVATNAPPRVEIHLKLAETDEREVRDGLGSLNLEHVTAGELSRCFGDCCEFTVGALAPQALHLKRLCFAAREKGVRKLSLATFVEAR